MDAQLLWGSAVIPSFLLFLYFKSRDIYPEPSGVLWKTFFFGVLSIVPVLIVALPMASFLKNLELTDPYAVGFTDAFFAAAIPEEFFKYMVLHYYCLRRMEFDEPMDGVVYGVTASLGFATLENIMYVSGGGLGVALVRGVTAVPCHAMLGAIMGYYAGRAKFAETNKAGLTARALAYPMLLHGLYDFPLLSMSAARESGRALDASSTGLMVLLFLAVLIWEIVWAVRLTKRLRREQMAFAANPEAGPSFRFDSPAAPPPLPRASPQASLDRAAPQSSFAQPPSRPSATATGISAWPGWLGAILGGLMASIGGLVCLFILIGIANPDPNDNIADILIGGTIIGVLPLALGLLLFFKGIKRLNRRDRALRAPTGSAPVRTSPPPLPGASG